MKVFISHQKKDRLEAQKIANHLKNVGIAVYFDEFDRELTIALNNNDPKAVVTAIKKGINQSTHMLCIVSPNTLTSRWVPFEVGYGYDSTKLSVLTLKGISNSDLPDYIKAARIIRDIWDIKIFTNRFGNKILLEKVASSSHPLSGIMDQIITKG